MLRKVLAVLAGIATASIIFVGFEAINSKLYPMPKGIDRGDHEAMSAYMESLPNQAFINVLMGWLIGSFICGMLIRLISRSSDKTPSYIAGLFLTTAGIVDIFTLPHPLWFAVAGIIVFIPFTLLGHIIFKTSKEKRQ